MTIEDFVKVNKEKFDIVTSWHSLEHLYSVKKVIALISEITNKGGILVISVPTSDGLIFKIASFLRLIKINFLIEEIYYSHNENMHFTYLNKKSIKLILSKYKFKIIETKTIECFDWDNLYKRAQNKKLKLVLKYLSFIPKYMRLTCSYNLIIKAIRT